MGEGWKEAPQRIPSSTTIHFNCVSCGWEIESTVRFAWNGRHWHSWCLATHLHQRLMEVTGALDSLAPTAFIHYYKDKPDNMTVSMGDWSEPRDTILPGVRLPEFQARIRYDLRDWRKAAAALAALESAGGREEGKT